VSKIAANVGRTLRVLLVDDSDDDAARIARQIRRAGFRLEEERVETAEELAAALDRFAWDLLILDYALPGLDALQALAFVRGRATDLPVIVVSGAVGEESAAAAMRAGAGDVLRKDNLARLGPIIARELAEAEHRRARRRAEEERARLAAEREAERTWLRAVIDESPVGIVRVEDPAGRRVVANRRAEELFGHSLPSDRGIAQYVGQIFRPDGTPRAREELATWRALRGETVAPEEELLRQPDGREVRVLVSAVPILVDGAIVGAVVAYEDVTRLRELERLRDEWTSIIAHDLRQPIAAIAGYAQLLQRQLGTAPGERGGRIAERLLGAARTLDRMVGDLLASSLVDARHLDLRREAVDPVALVREVAERVSPASPERPIRVVAVGAVPSIVADATRIGQVVENLLRNAVAYGHAGTEIVVEVAARDDAVEVAVTNHGDGIGPEEMPRLFGRFARTARARSERVEGLGLGLYISKGLVEAHGGRIWAESTPGETTTFRFSLPAPPLGRADEGDAAGR
jgi:PAS domain S-box-containing protein